MSAKCSRATREGACAARDLRRRRALIVPAPSSNAFSADDHAPPTCISGNSSRRETGDALSTVEPDQSSTVIRGASLRGRI